MLRIRYPVEGLEPLREVLRVGEIAGQLRTARADRHVLTTSSARYETC